MTTRIPGHKRYFVEKPGIPKRLMECRMERFLGEAFFTGGDYAEF